MAATDMELRQAFAEMQYNKMETTKKIKMIDMQCEIFKKSKQKYIITEKGTSDLGPDARVFMSIGRMFVLSDVPEMKTDLQSKAEKCESLITQLNEKKEFLLKSLKEQEDSLRELVQQKRDAK